MMAGRNAPGCGTWVVAALIIYGLSRCVGGDDDGSSSYGNEPYAAASSQTRETASLHRYTQASSLNCRAEPRTSARRIETLSEGTYVGVVRAENGWSLLDRSTPCWVSSSYLGSSRPVARPTPLYSGGGGGSGRRAARQSSWSYANCSAARAAGAAPVYRGEPGYGRHLDRDNDGVGCE